MSTGSSGWAHLSLPGPRPQRFRHRRPLAASLLILASSQGLVAGICFFDCICRTARLLKEGCGVALALVHSSSRRPVRRYRCKAVANGLLLSNLLSISVVLPLLLLFLLPNSILLPMPAARFAPFRSPTSRLHNFVCHGILLTMKLFRSLCFGY
ncbi:hypothetical protein ABW21_db0207390 [Orbilia brochopaga]|nr:hypothetical protein ABW21_db0207390 [Drechslerella brochopaga]